MDSSRVDGSPNVGVRSHMKAVAVKVSGPPSALVVVNTATLMHVSVVPSASGRSARFPKWGPGKPARLWEDLGRVICHWMMSSPCSELAMDSTLMVSPSPLPSWM